MARLYCLLTIILLSLVSASDASCYDPFITVGNLCIYVNSEEKMTWSDARDYCRALSYSHGQPDLAVVISCQSLNPLWQYLLRNQAPGDYWLGGYDFGQEGFWHWINNDQVFMGIPFWGVNSPNGDVQENCLMMMYPSGYFDDGSCTDEKYVICYVP